MDLDLELALGDLDQDIAQELARRIPAGFLIEDKAALGWGLVIRKSEEVRTSKDNAIDGFLGELMTIADLIEGQHGTLRVGVFFESAMCTVLLPSTQLLSRLQLALELSCYPSSDDS